MWHAHTHKTHAQIQGYILTQYVCEMINVMTDRLLHTDARKTRMPGSLCVHFVCEPNTRTLSVEHECSSVI